MSSERPDQGSVSRGSARFIPQASVAVAHDQVLVPSSQSLVPAADFGLSVWLRSCVALSSLRDRGMRVTLSSLRLREGLLCWPREQSDTPSTLVALIVARGTKGTLPPPNSRAPLC